MTRVSVRGEARLTVAPDLVRLPASLTATGADKADALRTAASALRRLTDDLAALGGVPLTVETAQEPLTWSAFRTSTQPEHVVDHALGRYEPTGRVRADVAVSVVVRDLARLDRVGASLALHEGLAVRDALWLVDADNPAWSRVRAAAIAAAVRKAADYAAALGGTVTGIEHLADVGLLDGASSAEAVWRSSANVEQSGGGGFEPGEVPSLDPVPRELVAMVEARFTAEGTAL